MTAVISSRSGKTKPAREGKKRAKKANGPTYDEIRILAYDLYQRRAADGTDGDAISDWIEAERQLADARAS